MKTKQCANCGAPVDNTVQCKYCKTVFFDETDNRLRDNSFRMGYMSTSTHAPYYISSTHYYGEELIGRR